MTAAATAECDCTSAINIAIDIASTTAASYGRWVHGRGRRCAVVMAIVMSPHGFGNGTSNVLRRR